MDVQFPITAVTVYPDSALIRREGTVRLSAGDVTVTLPGIIPDIDENTLRSCAIGEGVKILGAMVRHEYSAHAADTERKRLADEMEALTDDKRSVESDLAVRAEEAAFIESVKLFGKQQIPRDLATKIPAMNELSDVYRFISEKTKENRDAVLRAHKRIREIDHSITERGEMLDSISGGSGTTKRSIEIALSAKSAVDCTLAVSYLVSGASWEPIYDARADFAKSNVELTLYGIVRQTTGDAWDNVAMSLSTAKPSVGGSMPYVSPWALNVMEYEPPRAKKARSFGIVQKAAFADKESRMEEEEVMPMASMDAPPAPEEYSDAAEHGTAIVYTLMHPASVKSDGTDHKLPVTAQNLAAKYEYSSYPRSVSSAYLGSRVENAPNVQLLPGAVHIFLDGEFVGISQLSAVGPGEEFDIYLGIDDNVKVKREIIEKKVDRTLIAVIPSPVKKSAFTYKITVENYKSKDITVKLFEPLPISEDDRIKVKTSKAVPEATAKDWMDRKGVSLWEFTLAPKAKQEIVHSFTVEHPRELRVEGL
ncbi:MAG: DUF4139 domain-containing protein [Spirochaetota bacterium]